MKTLGAARNWAVAKALPLWSSHGRDGALYHERLDFEHRPVALPARRLMVQARQIATFSRASLAGWHGADDAHMAGCLASVERLYFRADGGDGWVFSIDPAGRPANATRDLYAHAFILYALAWSFRQTGDPGTIRLADKTLDSIDTVLAAPLGGFLDAAPSTDPTRRQNPHMHLLEGLLALYEATGSERYFVRAQALVGLARSRFIDPRSGALLEDFGPDWQPLNPAGSNRVEPGHLFEWAWLFEEYNRLGGDVPIGIVDGLLAFGLRHGLDGETGLIVDAVNETGACTARTVRSWPHAEGVKAFAAAAKRGQPGAAEMADYLLGRLMDSFAPDELHGGWIDRRGVTGEPLVDHMPASTLYHIAGAILEADSLFGSDRSA
ncbi:AGE family epimerase/isomerase [Kaistia dalseonensis]|uniref:Mannose-6-phosphate isomerase n=1 Tax=Kaistia dalseonensis TaxID=410840 RepID=A0ABU0H2V2_9HYPH|nr:AGE family epimerase/isomerase [Kaistia dalseonensis]MCX5493651.1 AGE family epimerase/isomerase [Kaistia dalseonensis]MDQ0436213.1 mannose-6-phosphate isomerase [Kaistia dalseonensis]